MKSSNKQTEKTGNKSNGIIKKMIVAIALIFTLGSTFAAGHYRGYVEHPVRYDYRYHEGPRWGHPVVYRYVHPVYVPYCR